MPLVSVITQALYDLSQSLHKLYMSRRLFPALMVNVQGLEPATLYNVAFRATSADPFRYRFVNMKWMIVGESEVDQNLARQISLHPDSPKNGESWMKRPISFKSIKLTHNPKSNNELVSYRVSMNIVLLPFPSFISDSATYHA